MRYGSSCENVRPIHPQALSSYLHLREKYYPRRLSDLIMSFDQPLFECVETSTPSLPPSLPPSRSGLFAQVVKKIKLHLYVHQRSGWLHTQLKCKPV